jgi:hypothetical protein
MFLPLVMFFHHFDNNSEGYDEGSVDIGCYIDSVAVSENRELAANVGKVSLSLEKLFSTVVSQVTDV